MGIEEVLKDLEHTIEYFEGCEDKFQIGRRYQAMQTLEQLRQHFVGRCNADSNKLVECRNCGDKVEMISSGEFCPHCFC